MLTVRRGHAGAAATLLVAWASACNAECSGPGCATSYARGRLSLVTGVADLAEQDVWDDARGAWTGTAPQGTDWSVGVVSNRILTGQPDADRVVATSTRASRSQLNPLSVWTGETGTGFGRGLATAPSTTGFDLWVSAPDAGFGQGAVHLFRATDTDTATHALDEVWVTLTGSTPNDQLGTGLAVCGDLVGDDGLAEVVVGAPWFAQPDRAVPWEGVVPSLAGAVFLIRSGALDNRAGTFYPWDVGSTWFGAESGEGVGQSVDCGSDLDGDGRADLLIGAPYAQDLGRVYVLYGAKLPADGTLEGQPFLEGAVEGDSFGAAVVTLDVGGEVWIAVGAPGAEGGTGRVSVYAAAEVVAARRGPTGAARVAPRAVFSSTSGGTNPGTHFGRTLAVGDLDGDGRDDLIVGTPDAQGPDNNDFDTGAVDVWFGGRPWRGTPEVADARVVGQDPFQRIGRAMVADDLDGDGLDELVVATRARTLDR